MSRIQVNFQPDPGGIYLIETKLAAPIPFSQEMFSELREVLGEEELPEDVGFCGMLQPAAWQADGTLVAIEADPTGQAFSLDNALAVFNQQCAGVQVPNPYILNPNLAEFFVENNKITGWRRIVFTLPEISQAGAFQASAEEDGSNPIIQSSLDAAYGAASMYGYGLGATSLPSSGSVGLFSWMTNLWDSASVPTKVGIAVGVVGLAIVGWKVAMIGAGVGAIKTAIAVTSGIVGVTAAAGAAYYLTQGAEVIVKPISQTAGAVVNGMNARKQGQPMPPGLAAGLGYSLQAALDAMIAASKAIQQGGQVALDTINRLNQELDNIKGGYGKLIKGVLVAGGIGLGGWLLYKLLSNPQRR